VTSEATGETVPGGEPATGGDRAAGGDPRRPACVIGGGLAGMVASLELVKLGFDVTLYEASDRLGGKAGSDRYPRLYGPDGVYDPKLTLPKGVASDHGYHVFPQWYVNMRRLWTEIGITAADVFEGRIYYNLPESEAMRRRPFVPEPTPSLRQLMSICELVLEPDSYVDNLTLQGFLYSRDYHDPADPVTLNDFVLNALTIGDQDVSARVIRNVFRQWLPVFAQPNWGALRGSLGELLIDRLETAIHKAASQPGAGTFRLRCRHRATRITASKRGISVTVSGDGGRQTIRDQPVVLALPPEVLRGFDSPNLYEHLPEVANLHYLRANPFSALDVFFRRRLDGVVDEHFTLYPTPGGGTRDYGITGFDISQHWPRLAARERTVLQFVAADSRGFLGLDEGAFVRAMATEIARYFPEVPCEVEYFVPHPNHDAPLFVNDVGTWPRRPRVRGSLRGTYYAGDFVQHDTEVTSMEGAVRSGLNAAEAIRQDYAPQCPPVRILPPLALPPALVQLTELMQVEPALARYGCLQWFKAQQGAAGT
jgi:hypothetical protein